MSFKQFTKELNGSRVEGEIIRTIIYSIITSAVILAGLYFLRLKTVPDLIPKYGIFIILAVLSYAIIIPTIRQVRAYKEFLCMSGMMIGMTSGMISGFLAGFYVGATNGMFVGIVFGMAVGMAIGIWLGSKCGVMGFLEGMMSGFMGGLMGAMTSVMLIADHLRASSIIVFVIGAIIMIALNYMIYLENKEKQHAPEDHLTTIIITFILTVVTTWIMVLGPRSALFQ
ncbi:MAG: hypothetical protein WCK90_05640 [archaeon]